MRILSTLLALLLPAAVLAAPAPLPDTTSLQLERPVSGETDYVDRLNQNAATLDAAVLDKRVGGTIVGDLTVTGSIIGNASLLTGIPSAISFITDNLISQVDGVDTTFNLSTAPAANSLVILTMDGLAQRQGLDFSLAGAVITMGTAPATNTYSFFVQYSTQGASGSGGAGGLTANPPILGIGSIANPLRLDTSSVTMLGPTISPAEVPLLASQLQMDQVIISTGNLQSQINSLVASPTIYADAPLLGNGGPSSHLRIDSSSVTLAGNIFNSASRLVQLDSMGRLPAVDGSQITNPSSATTLRRKSSVESVTTSTALQDDDELIVSGILANTTYFVSADIHIQSASASPDFKFGFSAPSGSSLAMGYVGFELNGSIVGGRQTIADEGDVINLSAGTPAWITVSGTILIGPSGGSIVFRWAQNSSDVTAVQVFSGSSMIVIKQ